MKKLLGLAVAALVIFLSASEQTAQAQGAHVGGGGLLHLDIGRPHGGFNGGYNGGYGGTPSYRGDGYNEHRGHASSHYGHAPNYSGWGSGSSHHHGHAHQQRRSYYGGGYQGYQPNHGHAPTHQGHHSSGYRNHHH